MSNSDHTTRTLLLSRKTPGLLLVSRGSSENIDDDAASLSSGHSQIRVFNISSSLSAPLNYATDGRLLGWGLRNSVGVAEHPVTGGVYSVENSADQLKRQGTDIHQDNPGEEMNFHGYLNSSASDNQPEQGGNYGYPHCFALWDTNLPNKGSMKVGSQFALDQGPTLNDTTCAQDYISPRLTFQAHMAPLDIKFTADGGLAYVSFHGSWNRDEPVGYKLSVVAFADGEPVEPADSTEGATDILSNADNTKCPGNCFRPAGLAIDRQGRVFMSSDATGEVYVLQRVEVSATEGGGAGGGAGGGGGGSTTASGGGTLVTSTAPGTSTPNAAAGLVSGRGERWLLIALTLALSVVGGAFLVVA
jgi:glucose/arabinose dehydrogenase